MPDTEKTLADLTKVVNDMALTFDNRFLPRISNLERQVAALTEALDDAEHQNRLLMLALASCAQISKRLSECEAFK